MGHSAQGRNAETAKDQDVSGKWGDENTHDISRLSRKSVPLKKRGQSPNFRQPEVDPDYFRQCVEQLPSIPLTVFPENFTNTKWESWASLETIKHLVKDTTASFKNDLPLLKLATFGGK